MNSTHFAIFYVAKTFTIILFPRVHFILRIVGQQNFIQGKIEPKGIFTRVNYT